MSKTNPEFEAPTTPKISVVIVGAGGLGVSCIWGLISQQAIPLHILVLDSDSIELSNLNRQVFFNTQDLGRQKCEVLVERARTLLSTRHSLNHSAQRLDSTNITSLLRDATLVIDATDSVETKLLINDYCKLSKLPFCYAGAVATYGQLLLIDPTVLGSACIRCAFDCYRDSDFHTLDSSCAAAGIIGAVAGNVGFKVAESCLEFLAGRNNASQLLRYGWPEMRWKSSAVSPSKDCPLGCGTTAASTVDLTARRCPETYLYTKLHLEKLPAGGSLQVTFANSESAENVARTVTYEGNTVSFGPARFGTDTWTLVIQKPAANGANVSAV